MDEYSNTFRRLGWATRHLFSIGMVLLLSGAQVTHATSATLFVTTTGSGTACTRSQPCALQTALDRAAIGDTIYLSTGTYTGSGVNVIELRKTLTLYGGWNGAATGVLVRDSAAYPTTLDGQNARRVVSVGSHTSPILDGLRLINGSTAGDGGGLYANQARLTVRNSHIFNNTANFSGGGVYVNNSASTSFINNQIHHNMTNTFFGGGVYLRNSPSAILASNSVYSNTANGGGGGAYLDNIDNGVLTGNSFSANTSPSPGGGVFLAGSEGVSLAYNRFLGNNASQGGGIYINNSPNASVAGNTVESNTSVVSGGGASIFAQSDGAVLTGNLFYKNTAGGDGAGIHIQESANATLINNVLALNLLTGLGSNGAGIDLHHTDVRLWHTTVARNSGGNGQGIHLQSETSASMINTILVGQEIGIEAGAGSTAALTATLWGSGAWANSNDSAGSGVISTGAFNIRDNPAFVDPDGGDYHIGPTSAAIDRGVLVAVNTDIDYEPRPFGDHDLGADEFWPPGALKQVFLPLIVR